MADPNYHVALLPSAGMGHLTPFLRLAAFLVHQNCRVTLITPQPTVSVAESNLISRFQSSFPQINQLHLHLLPFDESTANSTDPFWLRFESVRRSVSQLLSPLLASVSPPLSALIYDMTMISSVVPITESLSLPSYIVFTSSARMLSLYSYFPSVGSSFDGDVLKIPGISSVPRSSIPPLMLVPNSLFANIFLDDSPKLCKLNGIIINSFEGLEAQSIKALSEKKVVENLPPLFPLGPFIHYEFEKVDQESTTSSPLKWLDDQPEGSVVYVCFGSRTATNREQIREIGDGLVRSGCRFLWVVKDKKVDREDEEGLNELVGFELMKRLMENGLVVKGWVNQGEILSHSAVGGFLSHCGWNSVVEAAWHGVRVLAWPQHGDQKMNAAVVETSGLGIWAKEWGWGEEAVVEGQEIGKAIKEMMTDESLKINAVKLKEAARNAVGVGGSCEVAYRRLTEEWGKNAKSL